MHRVNLVGRRSRALEVIAMLTETRSRGWKHAAFPANPPALAKAIYAVRQMAVRIAAQPTPLPAARAPRDPEF